MMAEIQPMEQFLIHKVSWLPSFGVTVPGLGYIDLSVTNSVATMMLAAALISLFFLAAGRGKVVPGRVQAFGEILYDLADKGLTGSMIGVNCAAAIKFAVSRIVISSNCLPSVRQRANVMTHGKDGSEVPILRSHLANRNVPALPFVSVQRRAGSAGRL